MPVLIGGLALVPAPLVSISKQGQTAEDGTQLGQLYQIVLKGNLVAVAPGTTPVAEAGRLGVLLAKQAQLSDAFSVNGSKLEIYSPDGTNVVQCNPKVVSIEFTEGIWVDRTEYTVTLESANLYGTDDSPAELVSDISDQWEIEENGFTADENNFVFKPVWRITHNVSAKGRVVYDENGDIPPDKVAWKQARDWVIARLETANFDGRPFDTQAELSLDDGGAGYNHKRTENVDIIGGSFSISETWILTPGAPVTEDYTISVHHTPEDQNVYTVVSISGTVKGLSIGLNDTAGLFNNAVDYFNNTVKDNLIDRARLAVPGVELSPYGVTGNVDYNYAEGTITYNYDFNDRVTANGNDTVYDTYTVTKKTSIDEIETTVTVQGTIQGRLRVDEIPAVLLKYERAKAYWDALQASDALLDRAKLSGVSGLKHATLGSNVDYDFFNGAINYSYDFNNRPDDLARNEYTLNLRSSKEERRTTVSIEGTITGLRENDTDPYTVKYQNALGFWLGWESQLLGLVQGFAGGAAINIDPSSKSRGDNARQGTISYNYEYNTDLAPTIPDAISQQITTSETKPADVFAAIPVLGRKEGPVLQDIGSKKEKALTLSLEAVMRLGASKPNTDGVVASYKPAARIIFVDRDEESWTENTGHYSRTITWIYE